MLDALIILALLAVSCGVVAFLLFFPMAFLAVFLVWFVFMVLVSIIAEL